VRGGRALEREPPSDYRTQGPAAPSANARSVNPRSSSAVARCWRTTVTPRSRAASAGMSAHVPLASPTRAAHGRRVAVDVRLEG
jgi:hypothetical protein